MSKNFLEMSDEDFDKEVAPEATSETSTETPENNQETNTNPETGEETSTQVEPEVEEETSAEPPEGSQGTEEQTNNEDQNKNSSGQPNTSSDKEKVEPSSKNNPTSGTGSKPADNSTGTQQNQNEGTQEPDYVSIGKQVLAPFKANGKTITPRNAEEAIQLMQMGANYTQKMQQIQPFRKAMTMLQNAGMMDEGQLSFLIDLGKKDPEAIKKLIKDSGIDPMDLDTTSEPAYKAGKNTVSDAEVAFNEALDSLTATPSGQEVLSTIHNTWDEASKSVLGSEPQLMSVIQKQMESGIYGRIASEIDRQKTFGQIPPNMPFLEAYKSVGAMLDSKGAFNDLVHSQGSAPPVKTPVGTSTPQVKQKVTNSGKVAAAAPSRSSGGKANTKMVNPLAMSDEEFMKHEMRV